MRRTTTALLVVVLALAGSGCSGSDDGSGSGDGKSAATASPTADRGDVFVQSVIDAHLDSYTRGVPAADELKAFPPEWCDALDDGHTVQWILGEGDLYPIGETWGTEKTDAYQLVLLGTKAYCPKWEKQVRDDLRDSGEF